MLLHPNSIRFIECQSLKTTFKTIHFTQLLPVQPGAGKSARRNFRQLSGLIRSTAASEGEFSTIMSTQKIANYPVPSEGGRRGVGVSKKGSSSSRKSSFSPHAPGWSCQTDNLDSSQNHHRRRRYSL